MEEDEERVDDPAEMSQVGEGSSDELRPRPIPNQNIPRGRLTPPAAIWNYFAKTNQSEAKCNVCGQTMKVLTGSTTSLIRHLKSKHHNAYRKYTDQQKAQTDIKEIKLKSKLPTAAKQLKIVDHFKASEKWTSSHPKSKLITNAIGRWMGQGLHPYSIVEEEGFKYLMNVVEPKYAIPSRTTFSRSIIPELYRDTRKKIENDIKNNLENLASLSITTDMWTSASNESFISVTSHFVDSDFKLKSYCLGNKYFPEEHSGFNISSRLIEIVNEWGLLQEDTVPVFCITDNAKNMVSAVSLTPWIHLRCFAHTLQLALGDAKKEVPGMSSMLSKARSIVGHYKHSSAATVRLNKIQEQLGKPSLQLIQDCETRWNSEFKMLSRLIEVKQAISAELASTNRPHNLNANEWELAEGYVQILKPLDDATTLASSNYLPTLSMVLPLIDGIKAIISKYIDAGKKGVMFARALERAINLRYPPDHYGSNKHYLLAMLTDPRYKCFVLSEDVRKLAIDYLKAEAVKNMGLRGQGSPKTATVTSTSTTSSIASTPSTSFSMPTTGERREGENPADDEFSLWRYLQMVSKRSQSTISTELEVTNQIKTYLSVPTIPMSENPFQWWKDNGRLYPMIEPVAKCYLGIPATEVPSERVFSSAGNVVTDRRRNLTEDHVSELVFLHQNL